MIEIVVVSSVHDGGGVSILRGGGEGACQLSVQPSRGVGLGAAP